MRDQHFPYARATALLVPVLLGLGCSIVRDWSVCVPEDKQPCLPGYACTADLRCVPAADAGSDALVALDSRVATDASGGAADSPAGGGDLAGLADVPAFAPDALESAMDAAPTGGAGGSGGTSGTIAAGGTGEGSTTGGTGGIVATGGTGATTATGGNTDLRGGAGAGGVISSGGVPGTGGANTSGGTPGTGGATALGGSTGTGGTPATGGTTGTGETPFTLTVSMAGNGSGTVTSSPSGINCGSVCSQVFNAGSTVVLAASAAWVRRSRAGQAAVAVASEPALSRSRRRAP